jgi:hypothetical protein
MLGAEYAAGSVGPAFDPEELLAARRAGASVEELSDRAWAPRETRGWALPQLVADGRDAPGRGRGCQACL